MKMLAEHLERQLTAQLRKGLVVWLDREGIYSPFVDELIERHRREQFPAPVLAYRGSFLELMLALETHLDGLDSEPLLLHVSGHNDSSIRQTPLLEAYFNGTRFERALPTLIREAACGQVVPAEVERFISQEKLTWEGAENWLRQCLEENRTGLAATLQAMSPETALTCLLDHSLQVTWEAQAAYDYAERHCGVTREFIQAYIGEPQHFERESSFAEAWVGWLLGVEYVFDLSRKSHHPLLEPMGDLSLPVRKTCLRLLEHVRQQKPERYRELANHMESLIADDILGGAADELGRIDTFSLEDVRLLEAAVAALLSQDWSRSLKWAEQRLSSPSVWLKNEPLRWQEWQLVKAAAELGQAITANQAGLKDVHSLEAAAECYTERLFAVDQAHRHFEQERCRLLIGQLRHLDKLAQAFADLRKLYYEWADQLICSFTQICVQQGFLPESSWQQRTLYEQVVHPLTQKGKPVAYFMVDGLRYEMAAELAQRLNKQGLVQDLRARLAELPSVTKVGMNVLAPVCREGRLKVHGKFGGFRAGEFVVSTPEQRVRAMGERSLERLPGGRRNPLSLTLSKVQDENPAQLRKRVAQSPLVVVHSREIDTAGESDLGVATFETWLGQLHSAIQLLHKAGVEHFVITADHGFLILDESRKSLPTIGESPRYLICDRPIQQDNMASVATHSLAYDGAEKYLWFAKDTSTFKSPGSSARTFAHGGNSLQERVIPVLTLHFRFPETFPGQFCIEAQPMEPILGHGRLKLRVREGQNMLLGFGDIPITLALRVVDPVPAEVAVTCKQVTGGELCHQQIIVRVGADWSEVLFSLKGNCPRAALEIYQPDARENLKPYRLAHDFDVEFSELGPNPETTEEVPEEVPVANWPSAIENPEHASLLRHLEQFECLYEEEIVEKLGSPSAARKFARKVESYLPSLPFAIAVVYEGEQKVYVKKG